MKQSVGEYREVSVCAVPHRMMIVDGGVLFSNKSGFYGVSSRYMFSYRSSLWYLDSSESTFGKIPVVHLVKMHKLLCEYIGGDHTEADGTPFSLTFKK
jgi:hypothetical protein